MAQPTAGDVHVNRPMTDVSVAYIQGAENFIAAQVFPTVSVQKQSDRYWTYTKADWFRTEAQVRAPATESAGGGYRVDSTPNYFCTKYAVHKDVDDDTRTNTDTPLDADRDATLWVTQNLLLKRDIVWAATYFKTGVWGTDLTGVASGPTGGQFLRWDVSTSTPISDVTTAQIVVQEQTGFKPNILVVSPYVFNALRNNASILDRIKYTERGIVTEALLASLFGVDKVLIAGATNNTAAEGAAASMSFINGKHALLCYAPAAPSLQTPSAGYTFAWSGLYGAGALGMRIKSFRMEEIESDRIEGELAFDMKLVSSDVGYFFSTAVA